LEATRRSFNKDFLLALATDFKRHGASAIAKVRKQQPAAYMKICALLVPREMKVEHSGGVKAMTDEQLEQGIEAITAMLAARDAGADAKVIEAVPEPVALPAPRGKAKRKVRKSERDVGHVGTADESGNS
jgi:ketopantoate hydroxymethyltransferase